ncbi:MAG: hypothetical protein PVF43_14730, partial [Candidatus Eiseniibacteriota bacterium]
MARRPPHRSSIAIAIAAATPVAVLVVGALDGGLFRTGDSAIRAPRPVTLAVLPFGDGWDGGDDDGAGGGAVEVGSHVGTDHGGTRTGTAHVGAMSEVPASRMVSALLTTALSQVHGLSVTSRQQVDAALDAMRMRNGGTQNAGFLDAIARRLRVESIVTTEVSEKPETPESLDVTVTLVDVTTGQRCDVARVKGWKADDVFTLVDRLVPRIVSVLPGATAHPRSVRPVVEVTTHSVEAYRHFLAGWRSLRRDDRVAARRSFATAVSIDPGFALAHHGMMLACQPAEALRHAALALDLLHRATPADQSDIVGLAGSVMRAGIRRSAEPPYARPRRVAGAPASAVPASAAPAGAAPAEDAPSGDAPPGAAPTGDAPPGAAPTGDAPAGDGSADAAGRHWPSTPSLFRPDPLPVVPLGDTFDAGHAEYPGVVALGDALWMYYAAYGVDGHWAIALATSEDGHAWVKRGIVLEPDPTPGAWDGASIAFPTVLVDERPGGGTRFRLYYAGKCDAIYRGIGLATSEDGLTWTRRGRVLAPGGTGTWDAGQLVDPVVLRDGDAYRMYYCGAADATGHLAVGLATSADGVRFERVGVEPVYAPAGGLYTVDVLPVDQGFVLFESSADSSGFFDIHAVPSRDGRRFDPGRRRLVLTASRDGSWDHAMVYGMDVLRRGDTLHLWYNGIYQRMVTPGGQIGLATAELPRLLSVLDATDRS